MSADNGRFLVFFNEFSANLTPEAHTVIADAARRARETGSRAVRIEARASATGSPVANQRLEELRAKSGGIQMGGASGFPASAGGAPTDAVAKLSQAKEMLEMGLISDAEYESLKARIVSSM